MRAYFYGRFSAKKQEDGTSQERQIELAKQWCERKGIGLDESLSYFDRGMSGFHGIHRKRGGLGLFLAACEAKRVAPGSFLLVESLDRLSREQLQEGQALIKQLLFDYRVKLVVLFTGMEYTAENYQQTHWSIDAEFDRAYSESFNKSVRSKDNWERRRRRGGLLTEKVPTWLKVVDGKAVVDDEKAEVVRRMFTMAAGGYGFASIAKKFNDEGVKPFGRSDFWRDSVVEKIIKSRATLGEYQPMRAEGGKRVPVGAVRVGYFPAVVTADQFRAAQKAVASRKVARGRVTPKVSNLFTGLVYCGGDVLAYGAKAGTGYLQSGRRNDPGIRYDHFELAVLWWLSEVKLTLSNTANVDELRTRAEKLEKNIRTLKAKIDAAPDDLGDMLDTLAQWKRDHSAMLKDIESAIVPLQSHYQQSRFILDRLKTAKPEEVEGLRREARQAIRYVIDRIDVHATGAKYAQTKRVDLVIRFRDGSERRMHYRTDGGRLQECGAQHGDQYATVSMVETLYPDYVLTVLEVRHRCKAMREAGKSYKDIQAATGLNRITVYRYVTDYVRPEKRKKS